MDRNGEGYNFLTRKFPRISDAKIKDGIFVGPQIRELLNDKVFEIILLNIMFLHRWEDFS